MLLAATSPYACAGDGGGAGIDIGAQPGGRRWLLLGANDRIHLAPSLPAQPDARSPNAVDRMLNPPAEDGRLPGNGKVQWNRHDLGAGLGGRPAGSWFVIVKRGHALGGGHAGHGHMGGMRRDRGSAQAAGGARRGVSLSLKSSF